MSIIAAYAVPHPPLIVPAVGRGEEAAVADTTASFEEVARRIGQHKPDTIVITSPHAPAFRDGFFVSQTTSEEGSMAAFGHPQEALEVEVDVPFAQELAAAMEKHGMPCAPPRTDFASIDHGAYVPLYFLNRSLDLSQVRIVRIGLSGLPDEDHQLLGQLVARTANKLGRRCVLIASGDWSHKLKADGPYGFASEGPQFDEAVANIFKSGNLEQLFQLDATMCEDAAECGLRSFQIMAGALEGDAFTSELLSYEGPFGVGYGVAAFEVEQGPDSSQGEARVEEEEHGSDPLVSLARATVDEYVTTGKTPRVPKDFPEEYRHRKAGVFVSLHEHGQLRGCIGTIEPRHHSIAEEVIENAVSAATADPRFPAVTPDELDYLEYSVDVLSEPERVESLVELDPKHYGVIVSHGWKRGLLLPDLEGVDTVMDQIAIAKQKAGIGPNENAKLERFEVIRHTAGGAPRA